MQFDNDTDTRQAIPAGPIFDKTFNRSHWFGPFGGSSYLLHQILIQLHLEARTNE